MPKSQSFENVILSIYKPISTLTLLYGLISVSFASIPIILLLNKYAYDNNGNLVCDNYVLNSYLYTILGFCYIALGMLLEQKFQIMFMVIQKGLVALIIFAIFILVTMYYMFKFIETTNPNEFIKINTYYALACMIFGFVLTTSIMMGFKINVLYQAISITIGLTFLMAFIGYKYGHNFITVDFDKYLRYSLFGLIIWSFVASMFIRDLSTRILAVSIPGLIIFCLLLMSYNNKLRKNAEKCKVPNYPKEAIGLVIKIGNLLSDIINILMVLRGRKKGNSLNFRT